MSRRTIFVVAAIACAIVAWAIDGAPGSKLVRGTSQAPTAPEPQATSAEAPALPAAHPRTSPRRAGTVELLFTLPITTLEAVAGKFLAAWAFLAIAILLSFPMALTIGYLGDPDWGVVITTYLGTILMAGGYLGICALTSALTKNQVISFVLSVCACAVIVFLGFSGFTEFLEKTTTVSIAEAISNFSFITHYDAFTKGIIDPKDVVFFLSLMGFTLFLNVVVLER